MQVPDILLSGNHQQIENWRRTQSLLRTHERRPDLLAGADLSEAERASLDAKSSLRIIHDYVLP